MESRTQGSRPRPRTQKKSEAKAKNSLSEDRHSRGQGQECSRPRTKDTSASVLQKKKRSSQKFFKRSPQKNVFQKIFQALHKILTIQKILLSSSRGQANFRGLEASRPRPRTSKCVLEDVFEDSTSGKNRLRLAKVGCGSSIFLFVFLNLACVCKYLKPTFKIILLYVRYCSKSLKFESLIH